jgi:hypothetical protein
MQVVSGRYPQTIHVRVPAGLSEALAMGASVRNTSPAEYCRQAVLAALARDGVQLRDGRALARGGNA